MKHEKKFNIGVLIVVLGIIVSLAYIYNSYVTQVVTDAAYNDREILLDYNIEIIEKLISQESEETWDLIIEQYDDIIIKIENWMIINNIQLREVLMDFYL